MSIVGPRPALPEEVEKYSDYNKLRLVVTPGITCTWQIMPDKNDIPYEKWLEMDLEYIETRTTLKDIKIILKTALCNAQGKRQIGSFNENSNDRAQGNSLHPRRN